MNQLILVYYDHHRCQYTRSGKAKKTKDRKHPYEDYKGEGVVYLPGGIKRTSEEIAVIRRKILCR